MLTTGTTSKQTESKINPNRKTAIIVGVLYIIGTVAGVLSVVFILPVLGAPDYLAKIAANETPILIGSLLVLTMGFALAMVPVMLFSVLRQHNQPLALGYLIFRGALETVTLIGMVICWLFLILIGREYAIAGAANTTSLQTLGTVFLKGHDAINSIGVIAFCLGALMLYTVLYQSKLIPRWLSVWGLLAILLDLTWALLMMFRLVPTGAEATINIGSIPIFVQEMVMAVWLIIKGFNPSKVDFEADNQEKWRLIAT